MAKFRRSNVRNGRRSSKAWLPRVIILSAFIILAIFYLGKQVYDSQDFSVTRAISLKGEGRYFLPVGTDGQVIHHDYFSLSYQELYEQAEWVAYKLNRDQVLMPRVKYNKRFKPDYDVKTRSAFHRDYTNSGYTRGHLVPAADMSFDQIAIEQSYYMSNISPQLKAMNGGIWRELEEHVRDWVKSKEELYIISGPTFTKRPKHIGENKVAVPDAFYKILLNVEGSDRGGIAFLIPNELSKKPIMDYALTIDELEAKLSIDFFSDLLQNEDEEFIESRLIESNWPVDRRKYKKRINKWNNY